MLAVARYGGIISDVVVIFSVVTAIMQAMITVIIHYTLILAREYLLRDAVQLH